MEFLTVYIYVYISIFILFLFIENIDVARQANSRPLCSLYNVRVNVRVNVHGNVPLRNVQRNFTQ